MPAVPTANLADRIAGDRPETPALIGLDAGGAVASTLTYAELEAQIQARAAALAGRVGRGQTVGLLAENSPDYLVAFYAIERAGAVAVPISTKLPAESARELIAVSELRLLMVDGPARRLAPAGEVPLVDLGEPVEPSTFKTVAVDPEEIAMVLFTSGSTGLPKGVLLSHRSHSWVIDQLAVPAAPGAARVLIAAPLYHMNALSNSQRGLLAGATVVVLPRFEPAAFLRAVTEHRITRLSGVAPMFELLLQRPGLLEGRDLSSVTEIYLGSAPAAAGLFQRLRNAFPNAVVKHGFGTTESGPVVFGPHPDGVPTPDGSVGVPHPAVDLRLVGPDGVVRRDSGVLEVRSPALMSGYHNRPDVTPPITADGYHHTKDVFAVDEEGFYFFQGREDDMFVSGGENVYPRAVEQVLETDAAVREAVVVPVPDPIKGFKPVAFVTVRSGAEVTEARLKERALGRLEPYAHPRRVWVLEDMPLTGANKADRAALRRMAAQRMAG